MNVRYEVNMWTKFRGSEPITYKPLDMVHGIIDTEEKAIKFADELVETLEQFEPYKYEIVEKKVVVAKELKNKYNKKPTVL